MIPAEWKNSFKPYKCVFIITHYAFDLLLSWLFQLLNVLFLYCYYKCNNIHNNNKNKIFEEFESLMCNLFFLRNNFFNYYHVSIFFPQFYYRGEL